MTPKDKAEELLNKYWKSCYDKHDFAKLNKEDAKQCALIAVDEILAIFYDDMQSMWNDELSYWHQVKQNLQEQINILAK